MDEKSAKPARRPMIETKKEIIVVIFVILLSCQPRVTVTSCFVNKVIRDLESLDHLCINPIRRIGLIHKRSIDSH